MHIEAMPWTHLFWAAGTVGDLWALLETNASETWRRRHGHLSSAFWQPRGGVALGARGAWAAPRKATLLKKEKGLPASSVTGVTCHSTL